MRCIMKILIDGDSCKRKDTIVEVAKKQNIPVHIYCDVKRILDDDYAEIHVIDYGANNTDIAIANHTNKNDIVITNDISLAAIILAKHGMALNNYGQIFTNKNIDSFITHKHILKTAQRKSKRLSLHTNMNQNIKHPSFYHSLHQVINKAKKTEQKHITTNS